MRAEEQTLAGALKNKAADADAIASKLAAQSEREFANRRAVAAAIVDEAHLEGRCILDAARVKAAELVQEAERRAAEHQALVATAKQELAQITAGIEAKAGELSSVSAAVSEKHAQHERFTRLIGELTAKL